MADDHKPGNMHVTEQEKTFAGFMTVTKWVTIVIIAILVFLAIFRT
ncbi:aa3-type cytochrome c oxidase subunit IV [Jannaschia rubra]|nr:aa3-type cytochrome c oxidase subunit IV [Jannaschia rubra]